MSLWEQLLPRIRAAQRTRTKSDPTRMLEPMGTGFKRDPAVFEPNRTSHRLSSVRPAIVTTCTVAGRTLPGHVLSDLPGGQKTVFGPPSSPCSRCRSAW